jgi:TPR repeat protein
MVSFRSVYALAAITLLAFVVGCSSSVKRLPAKVCDSSNLKDCETQCGQNIPRACYRLGWYNERGRGLPKNVKKAVKLYDQACQGSMAVACRALGMIYARGDIGIERNKTNKEKARDYFAKACELGLAAACPTEQEKAREAAKKRAAAARGQASSSDSKGGISLEASAGTN